MVEFEVTLSPRAWRAADPQSPEGGSAFRAEKRAFWKRSLGWGKDLLHLPESPDPVPLSTEVAERAGATRTLSKPVRDGHPDNDYDSALLGQMDEKTPQFNLRNVPRYVMEGDHEEIEWARGELPDRRAYDKDLEEVRSARHDPPVLTMTDYAGDLVSSVRRQNRGVFYGIDWEQWLGREHKSNANGRLWEHKPADGGKRTRPWPQIRIQEHRFWKGRLITEKY